MGEIVNLRRVKRQLARDAAAKDAAENRVRHGMTKAAKQLETKTRLLAEATLDGAALSPKRLESGDGDGEPGEISG